MPSIKAFCVFYAMLVLIGCSNFCNQSECLKIGVVYVYAEKSLWDQVRFVVTILALFSNKTNV